MALLRSAWQSPCNLSSGRIGRYILVGCAASKYQLPSPLWLPSDLSAHGVSAPWKYRNLSLLMRYIVPPYEYRLRLENLIMNYDY